MQSIANFDRPSLGSSGDTDRMENAPRVSGDVTRQTSTSDVANFIAKYAPPIEDARRKWEEAFSLAKSTTFRSMVAMRNCAILGSKRAANPHNLPTSEGKLGADLRDRCYRL